MKDKLSVHMGMKHVHSTKYFAMAMAVDINKIALSA